MKCGRTLPLLAGSTCIIIFMMMSAPHLAESMTGAHSGRHQVAEVTRDLDGDGLSADRVRKQG